MVDVDLTDEHALDAYLDRAFKRNLHTNGVGLRNRFKLNQEVWLGVAIVAFGMMGVYFKMDAALADTIPHLVAQQAVQVIEMQDQKSRMKAVEGNQSELIQSNKELTKTVNKIEERTEFMLRMLEEIQHEVKK